MRGYSTLWTVIVDCIVLHYMHIWHLRIRASNLQFWASKMNMALAQMDKLVKKLMSNPGVVDTFQDYSKSRDVQIPSLNSTFLVYIYRNLYCLLTEYVNHINSEYFLLSVMYILWYNRWEAPKSINFGSRGCTDRCGNVRKKHFIKCVAKSYHSNKKLS